MEQPTFAFPGKLADEQILGKQARIKTAKGDIVIRLFGDTAPLTVSNFTYLANADFYDGVIFHRREEGFVLQGGDPTGTGAGGPGYQIPDELEDDYQYNRGIVAMANKLSPGTGGSQFFIMLSDVPLPKQYSIFGEVIEGMDVVDNLQIGDEMLEVIIEDVAVPAEGLTEEVSDAAAQPATEPTTDQTTETEM